MERTCGGAARKFQIPTPKFQRIFKYQAPKVFCPIATSWIFNLEVSSDVGGWNLRQMDLLTLTEIRRAAQNGSVPARVHVQVQSASPKLTREQQPYCELVLADACDRMTLRVWSDHPAYRACSALTYDNFFVHLGLVIRTQLK